SSFASPGLDLNAEATLALESAAGFAGAAQRLRGNVTISVAAKGPLAALQATARVRGEGLTVEQFEGIGLDATAAYDAASSKVRAESVSVRSPWARLQASGELDLHTPPGTSSVQFSARDLDLARMSGILH